MTNVQHNEIINDFFQIFVEPINKTLCENLDSSICSNIQFKMTMPSQIRDIKNLQENKAIYKLDYATGKRQGNLLLLIPTELIAVISDIVTNGTIQNSYTQNLSETETNSILELLEKTFKTIEANFKKKYGHNLAFSDNPLLLLEEMAEYKTALDSLSLDLLISAKLSLDENKKYDIHLLLNAGIVECLIEDLGLSKTNYKAKKTDVNSLDVNLLADVKINITAELGRTKVPIKYALELVRGSLVELDTLNNSDIKVFANGVEFAYAQVVAIEDNFGLKITKIISPEERADYV